MKSIVKLMAGAAIVVTMQTAALAQELVVQCLHRQPRQHQVLRMRNPRALFADPAEVERMRGDLHRHVGRAASAQAARFFSRQPGRRRSPAAAWARWSSNRFR